jgi:trehalose/maltose transport system substrate-binding protein
MFSISSPAKIFGFIVLSVLLIASLRGPRTSALAELTVLMEPDGTGVWRDIIERFNAMHPQSSVRLVEGPPQTDSREDMYSTAFLAGRSGYDIVYCDVVWVPKFAAAGWLLDLTDRLSAADRDDFLQADLEGGTYNGRLYRIPAFTDAGLLYYRSDLVRRPPETFQDVVNAASQLTNADRTGYLWQGKQYEGLVTNYLEVLWGYGGEWITLDRRVLLESEEALEALKFLKSSLGTISPPGVTTYTEEETRNLFQNGRSIFMRNWFYVWALVDQPNSKLKGKVAFVPMVHGPRGTPAATLGGWGFAVSRFSPSPNAAWDFVEFATRPEQLQQLYSKAGRIPARKRLVPEEFRAIVANARPRPRIPEYAQVSDILQRWVSAALAGIATPEDALRNAARETRAVLSGSSSP